MQIRDLISQGASLPPESSELEYKLQYSKSVPKTLAAFATLGGGTLLIGVDDRGTVIGIPNSDADQIRRQVGSACSEAVSPSIIPSIDQVFFKNGNSVVVVGIPMSREPILHRVRGTVYQRVDGQTLPCQTAESVVNIHDRQREYQRSFVLTNELLRFLHISISLPEDAKRRLVDYAECSLRKNMLVMSDKLKETTPTVADVRLFEDGLIFEHRVSSNLVYELLPAGIVSHFFLNLPDAFARLLAVMISSEGVRSKEVAEQADIPLLLVDSFVEILERLNLAKAIVRPEPGYSMCRNFRQRYLDAVEQYLSTYSQPSA